MLTSKSEDKLFKWMNWGLIFLALGFLSSPTIVSLFHILFMIPALIVLIKGPKTILPNSAWVLIAITAWGFVSTVYNFDTLIKPGRAFQELKFYLIGVLFIPGLHFYFKKASNHQVKKLISLVCVVIILAFFVGISKAWFGFDPVKFKFDDYHIRSGGFTNYMRYGYASSFLALFGIGIFFNRKNERVQKLLSKKMFNAALILTTLAIGTSQTRGALLALIVSTPFLLLFYRPKLSKILFVVGGIYAIIIVYCSFINQSLTNSRFLNINQASNTTRMSQFLTAVKSIQEKPVFGLGADQFSYNVKSLKIKYDIWEKDYSGHAHNIFLEHAANYGVMGAILLLLFLIIWGREMLARGDRLGQVIFCYIIAFFVSGQVENLFDNTNSHLFFFIYTMSQVYYLKNINEKNKLTENI